MLLKPVTTGRKTLRLRAARAFATVSKFACTEALAARALAGER